MQRSDWTLLVIAAAAPNSLDPVQLQKSLFLLGKNCPQVVAHDFYNFQPYNYGPFDVRVYQDAEGLQLEGHVSINRPQWRSWGDYTITPAGKEAAARLLAEQPAQASWEYINKLVAWVRGLAFKTLVKTIYEHYPEFQQNSVFRG
jgi:hypothetical protein